MNTQFSCTFRANAIFSAINAIYEIWMIWKYLIMNKEPMLIAQLFPKTLANTIVKSLMSPALGVSQVRQHAINFHE